jgi:predicted NBD/HSP70 family sugar kinase
MQREALEAQRGALAEAKELAAMQRRNLEHADEVNRRAAQMAGGVRKFLLMLLPLVIVLIGYLSWLLFFKLGLR